MELSEGVYEEEMYDEEYGEEYSEEIDTDVEVNEDYDSSEEITFQEVEESGI